MSPTQNPNESSCRCCFSNLEAPARTLFSDMSSTQEALSSRASRIPALVIAESGRELGWVSVILRTARSATYVSFGRPPCHWPRLPSAASWLVLLDLPGGAAAMVATGLGYLAVLACLVLGVGGVAERASRAGQSGQSRAVSTRRGPGTSVDGNVGGGGRSPRGAGGQEHDDGPVRGMSSRIACSDAGLGDTAGAERPPLP